MRSLLSCLSFYHENKIAHGDIKPGNILYCSSSGIAVLCDFGLSELVKSSSGKNRRGTFGYMSPEVHERQSLAADMWSVGVVLLQL